LNLWDALRQQLGDEFMYGPGHWFCVSHAEVRRKDGRLFSEKTGGSGRRVVLADRFGPNATLFARSASLESPFHHPAHAHEDDPGRCALDQDGWINFRLPVSVPSDVLGEETYSCKEPDGSVLYLELDGGNKQ
jgi:hypothetical protein